jgi:hypothetical protein
MLLLQFSNFSTMTPRLLTFYWAQGEKIVIDYTQIANFYSRKILAAVVVFRALWHRSGLADNGGAC